MTDDAIQLQFSNGQTFDKDVLLTELQNLVTQCPDKKIIDISALNPADVSIQQLTAFLKKLPGKFDEIVLDEEYEKNDKKLLKAIPARHDAIALSYEDTRVPFDKEHTIDASKAKISWVREKNQHAILLIELQENGESKIYKSHLRGIGLARDPWGIFKFKPFWGMHYRAGKVEVKDLTGKDIKMQEVLKTWEVEAKDAQNLLEYSRRRTQKSQYFNLLGEGALSSMFVATTLNQLSHSCVTWSREALLHAGIHIKRHEHINFATITTRDARGAEELDMDVSTMGRLARANENETIGKYFPKYDPLQPQPDYVDPNTILHRVTRGPFEYFMGKYTPLMIASAYGNHETVHDLITNHGANPYVNVKSRFFFGIFGRYSAFDCTKSLVMTPYVDTSKRHQTKDILLYNPSVTHRDLVIKALDRYINMRESMPDYQTTIMFFNVGYNKSSKISAASAFKKALESGHTEIDSKHKGALSQGELGKIFKDYDKYGLLDSKGQKQKDLCLSFKQGLEKNLEIGGTSLS